MFSFRSLAVLVAVFFSLATASSASVVCVDGRTETWTNVGACNDQSYCAMICLSQNEFYNGFGVEIAAQFFFAISGGVVPTNYVARNAFEWHKPGKHEFSSELTIFIEDCSFGLAGSSAGNICKGEMYPKR